MDFHSDIDISKLLSLLIFIGVMLANWWSTRSSKEEDLSPQPQVPSAEEEERARRIREEIRRRIAERRAAEQQQQARVEQPPAPPIPTPVAREAESVPPPLPIPPRPATPGGRYTVPGWDMGEAAARAQHEQVLRLAQERQRIEAEAARIRAAAQDTQPDAAHSPAFPATAARAAISGRSRAPVLAGVDLRDPAAARRAIILSEVLGPPVGLRPRNFIWE